VVQLIAQLDINAKHGSVFCLAATNALEAVDKALLQPGRFEEVIEMGMATPDERKEIIEIALKDVKHAEDVETNMDTINRMMDGMTASEIVGLVQKAAIQALIDHRDKV
jgi:transitional endoplasmic reticulum ATPase